MSSKTAEPYFNPDTGYFLLQLEKEDLGLGNNPIWFEGKEFQPKDEVHITIFGSETADQVKAALERRPELTGQIRAAIQDMDWDYELKDQWYHVVEDRSGGETETDASDGRASQDRPSMAESIIRMVQVEHSQDFFRRIEELIQEKLAVPPFHVTLYTYGDSTGIGIVDQAELKRLVQREVDPKEWG